MWFYVFNCYLSAIYATSYRSKTNEELDGWFVHGLHKETFRYDFLIPDSKLSSPLGRRVQECIPASIRWIFDPLLCIIFDHRLMNIDRDHFLEVRTLQLPVNVPHHSPAFV